MQGSRRYHALPTRLPQAADPEMWASGVSPSLIRWGREKGYTQRHDADSRQTTSSRQPYVGARVLALDGTGLGPGLPEALERLSAGSARDLSSADEVALAHKVLDL